eukprot:1008646_1
MNTSPLKCKLCTYTASLCDCTVSECICEVCNRRRNLRSGDERKHVEDNTMVQSFSESVRSHPSRSFVQRSDRTELGSSVAASPDQDREKLKRLIELGFTETKARRALLASDGNLERAADFLMLSPRSSSDSVSSAQLHPEHARAASVDLLTGGTVGVSGHIQSGDDGRLPSVPPLSPGLSRSDWNSEKSGQQLNGSQSKSPVATNPSPSAPPGFEGSVPSRPRVPSFSEVVLSEASEHQQRSFAGSSNHPLKNVDRFKLPPSDKQLSQPNLDTKQLNNQPVTVETLPDAPFAQPIILRRMTREELEDLEVSQFIDHRDVQGKWLAAQINQLDRDRVTVEIHYIGWARRWDLWTDINKGAVRFAPFRSLSLYDGTLKCPFAAGDFVNIKVPWVNEWVLGEVKKAEGLQVQVGYNNRSSTRQCFKWFHCQDRSELRAMDSGRGRTISGRHPVERTDVVMRPQSAKRTDVVMRPPSAERMNVVRGQAIERTDVIMRPQSADIERVDVDMRRSPDRMDEGNDDDSMRSPEPDDPLNTFEVSDYLEVFDTLLQKWYAASVVDKRGSKIRIRLEDIAVDEWLDIHKDKERIRDLGADIPESEIEKEIKAEKERFVSQIESKGFKMKEMASDGNCLFRSVADQVYNDVDLHPKIREACCDYMDRNRSFFEQFEPDFDQYLSNKRADGWGDHVDIIAICEMYNRPVAIMEVDQESDHLSHGHEVNELHNLPIIRLSRHRQSHYNSVRDPSVSYPLGDGSGEKLFIREARIAEDRTGAANAAAREEKHPESAASSRPSSDIPDAEAELFENILSEEDFSRYWDSQTESTICQQKEMKFIYRKFLSRAKSNSKAVWKKVLPTKMEIVDNYFHSKWQYLRADSIKNMNVSESAGISQAQVHDNVFLYLLPRIRRDLGHIVHQHKR